jgi:hypothetical protein
MMRGPRLSSRLHRAWRSRGRSQILQCGSNMTPAESSDTRDQCWGLRCLSDHCWPRLVKNATANACCFPVACSCIVVRALLKAVELSRSISCNLDATPPA